MSHPTVTTSEPSCVAERLTLRGRVQGLGLRPAAARLAAELELSGHVRNSPEGVEIEIEGRPAAVTAFSARLLGALPPGAVVEQIDRRAIAPRRAASFRIDASRPRGPMATPVPADRAVCHACLADVAGGRAPRRRQHAFTSCTACGPRYSIIQAMPYDRAATGMGQFQMCDACRQEYEAPADRRFHAQTNACVQCGPQLAGGSLALAAAAAALGEGRIVALRGVGGYQLLCDATSATAVARLRQRKHRPARPLAVLAASLAAAQRLAVMSDDERRALADPANPIVIVGRRPESPLAAEVSRQFNTVGILLPTTPLHALLAEQAGRPLVCTSGNREGEPLAFDQRTARGELEGIADVWLDHDRPIVRPIDDSVVRVMAGRGVALRMARGWAPRPLDLPLSVPVLAVGGQQKSAVAICNGAQAVLGPHVGDLESAAARKRFTDHVESLSELYGARPTLIVHDLHPDYFTTRWAGEQGLPTLAVQHHHAHAAAGMLEQGWLEREVMAVTWDGTGYGSDGSIWGGEFLLATAADFRRVACCRPFCLPGGETAIRQPWRTAVAVLQQFLPVDGIAQVLPDIDAPTIAQVAVVAGRRQLAPRTTSVGRLFDAVAAIVLGTRRAEFEGEAAMLLEAACDPAEPGSYTLPLEGGSPAELDWRPLLVELLADRAAGAAPASMAMRFHRALAEAVVGVAGAWGPYPVVLTGGVFQNRVLVELIAGCWPDRGPPLGLPGSIPPGDGGLAAGQLAIALVRAARRGGRRCV